MLNHNNVMIERLSHSAIRLTKNKTIYIDPFKISESKKGDVVLISHDHFDHCSIEDLQKICDSNTIIVCPPDCQSKIMAGKVHCKQILLVKPGVKLNIDGIRVEAVHAYNTNKNFHPKENDWVGYLIDLDGTIIYHAGDTDVIPEMSSFKNIDVACLPVSGTYVMTAKEAIQAAGIIKPKISVPMHYGTIIGTKADADEFKRLWNGRTEILG
ncbi:MAG: MBL fold metallo-hydrolase [Nanoarchaeota archaeon]